MTTLLESPAPTADRAAEVGPDGARELRRAAVACLATALSVAALIAVLRPGAWLPRSLGVLALVMAIGVAGRALRLPRPALALLQFAAATFTVMALQASHYAPSGFLPGKAALRALGRQFDDGVGDLSRLVPPDHPSHGITTVVVVAAAAAAIAVDLLAVSYRRAHLAGLALLALYATPAATLPNGWRGAYFLLPALGYLALLLEEHADRVRRWGDAVVDTGTAGGRFGLRIAIAVLSCSLAIPAVLPAITGGLFNNSGIGRHQPEPFKTRDPLEVMRNLLVLPLDAPMFDYTTDSTWPEEEYLHSVTLDSFDGIEWKAGNRNVAKFTGVLPPPPGLAPIITTVPVRSDLVARGDTESDYLPMPRPALSAQVKGDWRVHPGTGDVVSLVGRRQITGKTWTSTGLDLDPDPNTLPAPPEPVDPTLAPYLALPTLPPTIAAEARRITAGAANALAVGIKLQDFFRDPAHFTYDLRPAGSGIPAIIAFLKTKHGYAEQYAATMAVMARVLGIPARLAVGFTAGHTGSGGGHPGAGGARTVNAHDAHAWPELFLPDFGWTRFEPTAPNAPGAPHRLHWLIPVDKPPPPKPQKQHNQSQAEQPPPPPPPPPPPQSFGGRDQCGAHPEACEHKPPPPHDDGHLFWLLLGFGVLLLAATPRMIRTAVSRRRWAAITNAPRAWHHSPAGAARIARVAWLELRDSAIDLGHHWPAARTPRQSALTLAEEANLSRDVRAELEHVVHTIEQVRYAPPTAAPVDHERLRTAVLRVRPQLVAAAHPADRARALVLPRSLGHLGREAGLRLRTATARPLRRIRRLIRMPHRN